MDTTQRIAYQPALDGVRALAVAVVLLFHAEVPGFGAGYLGVSVFFTLSGFLITLLMIAEHGTTGSIDLVAFYARRLRRLLPASVVTVGVIAVLTARTDLFEGVTSMRRQIVGSLLQVVNWVFLADDGSYQERLAAASGAVSPLEHFWSLAIEEQFYWVWPLTVLALFTTLTSRRGRTAALAVLTVVAMAVAPMTAALWGGDAAYWATPARLAEILVGALLAMVVAGRTVSERWALLAPIGLVLLGVFVVAFPSSERVAGAGLLPVVAVVSGLLLLGLQTDGPVRAGLSVPPLVWLGRISYGVYVFHWPIFVIVDPDRIGVDGITLFVIRVGLTLVIAQLSYDLVEYPIRRGRPQWTRPTLGLSAIATVGVLVAAWVIVPPADADYWRLDSAAVEAAAIEVVDAPLTPVPASTAAEPPATSPSVSAPTTIPPTTVPPTSVPPVASTSAPPSARPASTPPTTITPTTITPTTITPTTIAPASTSVASSTTTTLPPIPQLARPVRILVTGDSTAQALGTGVVQWAAARPRLAQAEVVGAPGCGFLQGGEIRQGDSFESMDACDPWADQRLLPAVERTQPDVVVVMVTAWDLVDRRWDPGPLLHPTDPEFRLRLEEAYGGLVDDVTRLGAARVAFVRPPIADPLWLGRNDRDDEARRHAVLGEVHAQLAREHPDTVTLVPLAQWFTEAGLDDDRDLRPDGVHLSPDGATQLTEDRLGEQLVRIALGIEAT